MSEERGDIASEKNRDILITFKINNDRELLNAIDVSAFLDKVSTCCYLVTAQIMFSEWIKYNILMDDYFRKQMVELERNIVACIDHPSEANDRLAHRSFTQLVKSVRAYELTRHSRLRKVEFLFAGSYIENPTNFRFIVNGSTISLLLIVFIFGGIQGKKEWDADSCLIRADNLQDKQMKDIKAQIRIEGKMTENHIKSQEIITKSANKMRQMCGSMFHGIEIIVDFSSGLKFIVRSRQQGLDPEFSDDRKY